ncbi:MAG: flagellar basal body-associated FliL family protein [Pseudomonadota bacterium]
MAESADTEDTKDEQPATKSGGGMIGMIILALGCAGSAFGMVYLLTPTAPPAPLEACVPGEAVVAAIPSSMKAEMAYQELPEILITVGQAPATRYLKMSISVVAPKDGLENVKKAEPVLMDAFNNYLRSLTLADFEDPGFYPHMREQLGRRAELVLGSAGSDGVLITEFLLR